MPLRDDVERCHLIPSIVIVVSLISGIRTFGHAQSQPSQSSEAVPPLIEAIWSQDFEKVKKLLADGADPNARATSDQGVTSGGDRPAWAWAITARDDRSTELLLSEVKTVDSAEAFLVAANRNDVNLVRALLDKGMPVDVRGFDGVTALLIAAASGHVDTLRLLIERGASVNLADNHSDTALMAAVRAGSIAAVKVVLAAGADVNARDQSSRTALTWAGRSRRRDVMDVLRATGAQGDISNLPRTLLSPQAAVARSLPLIQQGTATWNERQPCGACHHHPLMFRATAVAQRQGFAVNAPLLKAQIERVQRNSARRAVLGKEALASETGVLRWSLRLGGDQAFTAAQVLSSFVEAGFAWPSLQTEALLLARMQLRDGSWRYGPPRVPIMSSDFSATASAIRSLQAFGSPIDAEELNARIARATTWLQTNVPVTTEDKVFRLFGLHWAKSDAALLSAAVTLLRNDQNPDGGWSQLRGLNSDAYATGQVLVVLHEAGSVRTDDPQYQRGVRYLLETQESDGSWLVHKRAVPINGYFESGFPHGKFQFISYAGTCWAAMALSYAAVTSGRR
jgi:Ankyrin repeats (3 copies)/Squalene-hopene cyclase C-terminal domain/Ankyrin repeat